MVPVVKRVTGPGPTPDHGPDHSSQTPICTRLRPFIHALRARRSVELRFAFVGSRRSPGSSQVGSGALRSARQRRGRGKKRRERRRRRKKRTPLIGTPLLFLHANSPKSIPPRQKVAEGDGSACGGRAERRKEEDCRSAGHPGRASDHVGCGGGAVLATAVGHAEGEEKRGRRTGPRIQWQTGFL